jgi:hypothetical protein
LLLRSAAIRLPKERGGDEGIGERGRGAGDEREGERAEPQKEEAGRQAVRAGLEHAPKRDVDALRGSAGPGERAGGERERSRARRGDQETAGEPAASADGEREQRLEPLLGLLLAQGRKLEAAEEADREDHEEEGEAEVAGGGVRGGTELLQLALYIVGDGLPNRLRDDADHEREAADPDEPGEEEAALEAERLGGRRAQQAEPGRSAVPPRKEAGADVAAGGEHDGRREHA